jgi:hypothetical protein
MVSRRQPSITKHMITILRQQCFVKMVRKYDQKVRRNYQRKIDGKTYDADLSSSEYTVADACVAFTHKRGWFIVRCDGSEAARIYKLCEQDGYIDILKEDDFGQAVIDVTSKGNTITEKPIGLLMAILNHNAPAITLVTGTVFIALWLSVFHIGETLYHWIDTSYSKVAVVKTVHQAKPNPKSVK